MAGKTFRSLSEMCLAARKSTGLNQSAFAERIGITGASASTIESGKRNPSHPTLTAWMAASGHEVQFVMTPIPATDGET